MWKGLCGMDVDLLKAIWNGVEMDMDPYVCFVAWIPTLLGIEIWRLGISSPIYLSES
jgi:hypothetical protein